MSRFASEGRLPPETHSTMERGPFLRNAPRKSTSMDSYGPARISRSPTPPALPGTWLWPSGRPLRPHNFPDRRTGLTLHEQKLGDRDMAVDLSTTSLAQP